MEEDSIIELANIPISVREHVWLIVIVSIGGQTNVLVIFSI